MEILTIGIPIFNENKYLSETLYSLLNQQLINWKAIVADNCSTDDSYIIAKKIASTDQRISVIRHKNNISALDNFLFTLKEANSKYFVWLSGHDLFEKEYLEKAVSILEKRKDISMVYPKSVLIDKDNKQIGFADSKISSNGLNRRERMRKVAFELGCCTAIHGVFRRDILVKSPFKKVIGSDHLIIFSAASYGELYELPWIGIKRRKIRNESFKEQKQRWQKEGICTITDKIKPHAFLAKEHIFFILKAQHLSFYEKLYLLIYIKKIFKNRFGISLTDLFHAI